MQKTIPIQEIIYEIRGQRIMLDNDLAHLYGVPTYRLNEAVKRNFKRFPGDFMFQLTQDEWDILRSQIRIYLKSGFIPVPLLNMVYLC